jgi:hypothetical protein
MTTRALNWYIGARTKLQPGYSVQVCPWDDAAREEVAAALVRDGLPVRAEADCLWAGDGPDVDSLPQDAPEDVE